MAHLCGKILQVGVKITQQVEALLEKALLSMHVGQHLEEKEKSRIAALLFFLQNEDIMRKEITAPVPG